MKGFSSLRSMLTVPLVVASVLLGLATYLVVEHQIRGRLLAEFDAKLVARGDALRSLVQFEEADPEEGEDEPFLEFDFEPEFMPEFGAAIGNEPSEDDAEHAEQEDVFDDEAERSYFQLWDDERTLWRSESLENRELPRDAPPAGTPVLRDITLPDGRAGRLLTVRFLPYLDEEWGEAADERLANLRTRYPGLRYPAITLAVAASREGLDATIGFVQAILGAGLLILVVVIAALVGLIVTRGLRPLRRLAGQLDGIDARRLNTRVDVDGLPAEMIPVASTANELLDRLHEAFEKERRFSRNVAHELRTPIAELRSIGEVGARWPDDPAAAAQFFGDIGQITNRMDLMVTNLLMMARQENGQNGCAIERVDLVRALHAGYQRFNHGDDQASFRVSMHGPSRLDVKADRVYLDIVASNLFSNAIHHGGGHVDVRVFAANGHAGFEMENPVTGLTESDLPHLFEYFWRKDQARTAGRHVGLGLPLVRSLADACGWAVDVALTRSDRFRVRVTDIPAA